MKTEAQNRSRHILLFLSSLAFSAVLSLGGTDAAAAVAPVPGAAPAQILVESHGDGATLPPPPPPPIDWDVVIPQLTACFDSGLMPDTNDGWQTVFCRPLTEEEAEQRAQALEAKAAADAAAAEAAARAALPPETIEPWDFLNGRLPDYRSVDLCRQLGGQVQSADGGERICSGIDEADTFCIVGSQDAFPCRGLFKHVLLCNHYNRPAKNPFLCAPKCEREGACGNECVAESRFVVPDAIPQVAAGYTGEVARLSAGELFVVYAVIWHPRAYARATDDVAAVGLTAPLAAGEKLVVHVSGSLSCARLGNPSYFISAATALTITALTPPTLAEQTYYFEAGDPQPVSLRLSDNLRDLPGLVVDKNPDKSDTDLLVDAEEVGIRNPELPAGTTLTATAEGTAPGLLGTLSFPIRAEIRPSVSPVFGIDRCVFSGARRTPNPALAAALDRRDADEVCRLLRTGADPNAEDPARGHPLHIAIRHDWTIAAAMLRANGMAITLTDRARGNALNYAAFHAAPALSEWLLALPGTPLPANVRSGGAAPQAPLHALADRDLAAPGDPVAVAQLLLRHGADANITTAGHLGDGGGRNYLHILTANRGYGGPPPDHRPLAALLNAGLDPYAVILAAPYSDEGADLPSPSFAPAAAGPRPHLFAVEDLPLPPLYRAAKYNYPDVVADLLAHGVDPNRRQPDDGTTALFHARSAEVVRLLHQAGAEVNARVTLADPAVTLTAMDAVLLAYINTPSAPSVVLKAERKRRLDAVSALGTLGGSCLSAPALPPPPYDEWATALCDIFDRHYPPTPGAPAGEAACEAPEPMAGGAAHVSLCRLTCATAAGESTAAGTWRCDNGTMNLLGPDGEPDPTRLELFRQTCEARAPAESGLSCPAP